MKTDTRKLLEISKTIIWVFEAFPADKAAINMLMEQLPKLKKAVGAFEHDELHIDGDTTTIDGASFKGILHELSASDMDCDVVQVEPFGGTATIHG